jgi:hypothetical protein
MVVFPGARCRRVYSSMSNIQGSGYLGNYIRDLRERAAMARRIAKELSDEAAAKRLETHAHHLEREARDLEGGTPRLLSDAERHSQAV